MNFDKILTEGLDDTMNDIKNLKSAESGQNPAISGQPTPASVTPTPTTPQSNIKVARYKNSRNFGVWWGEELIVVAVYLKGANRVAELLRQLEAKK
jgi:hypothetical protein